MNRKEVIKEMNDFVHSLNKEFSVVKTRFNDEDLVLDFDGHWLCWFDDFNENKFHISVKPQECENWWYNIIAETGIIHKFYTKGVKLLSKINEKKYTVQVIKNSEGSFLAFEREYGKYTFWTNFNNPNYQVQFTQKEIKKLKKCDDLAIDWSKAIIKEVRN